MRVTHPARKRRISPLVGRIETAPGSASTLTQGLTHSLDRSKEQAMSQRTRTCSVDGCERGRKYRLYCNMHYRRAKANAGDPGSVDPAYGSISGTCSIQGCDQDIKAKRLCGTHYQRISNNGTPDLLRVRRTCAADGCEKHARAHGLCGTHWQRWQRIGTTDTPERKLAAPERFWAKVDKAAGPDACWIWTASKTARGYGRFQFKGKTQSAHRMAWFLSGRELPELPGVLDHLCFNTLCVNPSHLRVLDMVSNALRHNPACDCRGCLKGEAL